MNSPFCFFTGLILILFAVIRLRIWKKEKKKLQDIVDTLTSKINALLCNKKYAGKIVEVKGTLVTKDEPLLSFFTRKECVFYHTIERDKVRSVYHDRDGILNKKQEIYYSTSTDERSSRNFFIEDETGKIAISPEGFEVEGKVVLKKVENRQLDDRYLPVMFKTCGEKIIAVEKTETILPAGQKAYVIGELFIGKNGPFIGSDPLKEKTCFISLRSEESVVDEASAKTRTDLTMGLVALILGIFLFLLGC